MRAWSQKGEQIYISFSTTTVHDTEASLLPDYPGGNVESIETIILYEWHSLPASEFGISNRSTNKVCILC